VIHPQRFTHFDEYRGIIGQFINKEVDLLLEGHGLPPIMVRKDPANGQGMKAGKQGAPTRGCKPKPLKIPSPQLQLRSAIAQVGGKKELTGRTDIEIEVSNPCARLIANAIVYYHAAILSRLLAKYEASGNAKALALIKQGLIILAVGAAAGQLQPALAAIGHQRFIDEGAIDCPRPARAAVPATSPALAQGSE